MAEPNGDLLPGTIQMFVQSESGEFRDQDITLTPPPTNSPNDPLSWSPWRKYWHAALVLYITAFTAAIANDAGAASDGMLEELGISYGVANTAAGVLFASIGYWCLLASPMPWLYGRRIQYLICLVFALVGSVWFARIRNPQDSIWNQMFVGASESCAEALAQLSLSDLYFQHQRGTVLGIYILATSIGTFLGPLIAGYIAIENWRWVGWTGAIISGGTLFVFYFGLEETSFHREALLGRHSGGVNTVQVITEDKRDVSGRDTLVAHSSNDSEVLPSDRRKTYRERIAIITPAPNMVGTGLRQYFHRLFHTLRVFFFPAVIYSGLQWGAQDAWLTFYLTVEEDSYYNPPWNYSNEAVAIMNVPTLIGATIGCIYGGWFSDTFVKWMAKRRGGISEAEDRLWLMYLSAIVNPAGLMLFGIGSDKAWNWPGPYVGLAMIGFGFGCAGDLSMAYLMDAYPDMVLEGMVGVAVINNSLACVFTFVTSYWIDGSGIGNTFIAIGVLSFVFHMTTVPMMIWGKDCRRWTQTRYQRFLSLRDGER
jgi:MFS family permease